MNRAVRYTVDFIDDFSKPARFSWITIVLFLAWAAQMGEWHWTGKWGDWRGWVGFMCGWIAARLLEAVITEVRTRIARRKRVTA